MEIALTHFRAGVTALLRTWPALHAAVQNEWGGIESHDKANDLRTNIFEYYDGSKAEPMTLGSLEDQLVLYLEEEFSVVLEDESERQIAYLITRLYQECSSGDNRLAEELVRSCVASQTSSTNHTRKVIVEDDDNDMQSDDDDYSEDEMEEDDNDDDIMEDEEDTHVEETAKVPSNSSTSQSVPPNATTSAATTTTSAAATKTTEFQYSFEKAQLFIEGPLFPGGRNTKSTSAASASNLPPPRQLGEPEPEKPKVELDEDGFAPVVSRGRKRK